jgi:ABC-2 type transport system permease protein
MVAIAQRDVRFALRSRAVSIPLIVLPLVLLLLLPLIVALNPNAPSADFAPLAAQLPAEISNQLAFFPDDQRWIGAVLTVFMAPLFLIIPMMVAAVLAADSFAGERERGTLEPLLYAPISSRDLWVAKLAAPWIAALGVSLASFVLYSVIVNVGTWAVVGRVWFPTLTWVVLILWAAPAVAGLGLGAMVLTSSRVSTFQDAYQLGGLVVLPLVGLTLAQVAGALVLGTPVVFAVGLVAWVLTGLLLWRGGRRLSQRLVGD